MVSSYSTCIIPDKVCQSRTVLALSRFLAVTNSLFCRFHYFAGGSMTTRMSACTLAQMLGWEQLLLNWPCHPDRMSTTSPLPTTDWQGLAVSNPTVHNKTSPCPVLGRKEAGGSGMVQEKGSREKSWCLCFPYRTETRLTFFLVQ